MLKRILRWFGTGINRKRLEEIGNSGQLKIDNTAIKEYTCWNCNLQNRCQYAYDRYNLFGDCLAEK